MSKNIVFIHSLNNFTGSPNVLSVVIKGFVDKGYKVELYISRGEGFLSGISGITYRYTVYKWSSISVLTFVLLLVSQLQLFFSLLLKRKKNTLYYINTIVPFGAVLACWLSRKQYVIHVHENMQQHKPLYYLLRRVYSLCNRKTIFVSHYLEGTALNCRNGLVVHNSLDEDFLKQVDHTTPMEPERQSKTVLMVASLRRYKGIYEFAKLAQMNAKYPFELILSATPTEVERFRKEIGDIPNLKLYSMQKDLHPFYHRAGLLLQLSQPESWIETFGMTILEAMCYGVPSIVPPVGGPVELLEDGVNGYILNPHDLENISKKIQALLENETLYRKSSLAALEKSKQFNASIMVDAIEKYLFDKNTDKSYV